jgi:hypothetical protein
MVAFAPDDFAIGEDILELRGGHGQGFIQAC